MAKKGIQFDLLRPPQGTDNVHQGKKKTDPIGDHACVVCGTKDAPFGYGGSILRNQPIEWRCGKHRKGG